MKEKEFSFTYNAYDSFICEEVDYVVKVKVSFENKSSKSDEVILKEIKKQSIESFLNCYNNLRQSDGSGWMVTDIFANKLKFEEVILKSMNVDAKISKFNIISIDYSDEAKVKLNEAKKLEVEAITTGKTRDCKAPTKTAATSDELTLATKNSTGGGINVVPYIVSGIFIVLFVAVVILIIKRKKNSTSF